MQSTQTNQQPEDIALYRETLHKLITMGTEIAETHHKQAITPGEPDQQEKASIAFDRIARAVRRTIALAQNLNTPKNPPQTRTAARKKIIRRVEDSIQGRAKGPRAESLREELFDRIDTHEFDNELATRDINEIIEEIIDDLGLSTIAGVSLWKRRTPEDIKILNEKAEAPPQNPHPQTKSRPRSSRGRSLPAAKHPALPSPDRPKTFPLSRWERVGVRARRKRQKSRLAARTLSPRPTGCKHRLSSPLPSSGRGRGWVRSRRTHRTRA